MTYTPQPYGTSRWQDDGERPVLAESGSWTPAMAAQQDLIDAIEADLAVINGALDLLRGKLS